MSLSPDSESLSQSIVSTNSEFKLYSEYPGLSSSLIGSFLFRIESSICNAQPFNSASSFVMTIKLDKSKHPSRFIVLIAVLELSSRYTLSGLHNFEESNILFLSLSCCLRFSISSLSAWSPVPSAIEISFFKRFISFNLISTSGFPSVLLNKFNSVSKSSSLSLASSNTSCSSWDRFSLFSKGAIVPS